MTDLIIKSLKGILSPEERETFDVWLGRPGNRDLYRKVEKVWNDARSKACADKVVVSLVEGTVKLIPDCWSDKNFSDSGDDIRIITSGETAYYRKSDSSISVDRGKAECRSLWARDRIVFFNDDIVSVCRRLSVWYDVEITVSEDIDRKARLSFTVTDEPLDVILFLIRKASPDINYRYLEDGSVHIY